MQFRMNVQYERNTEEVRSYKDNEWGLNCKTNMWSKSEWVMRKRKRKIEKIVVGWNWWNPTKEKDVIYASKRQWMNVIKTNMVCKDGNVWSIGNGDTQE